MTEEQFLELYAMTGEGVDPSAFYNKVDCLIEENSWRKLYFKLKDQYKYLMQLYEFSGKSYNNRR